VKTPAALPTNPELRVFGVALLALLAVVAVLTFAGVHSFGYHGATPGSVFGLLAYLGLIWVLPAGAPVAVLGALLSIRLMRREPAGRPFWFWAWRAVAAGALLGAAGTAGWFVVMFSSVPDHLRRVIGPVTGIGAGAGIAAGLIVALYCWRICRMDATR
jgi:hypothetical protein